MSLDNYSEQKTNGAEERERETGEVRSNMELCVNKMGHTMFPPPRDTSAVRFRYLFLQHRFETLTYCFVFWSFGMCVAFLGPTLLDLGCRLGTVFSAMSWVFFSQSLFTLVGSALGGIFVQRIDKHLVLLISTIMLSMTLGFIPQCQILGHLAGILAVMGFFMGTIDTVANISMIHLYGRNVAPFLQALHFFYGLGAFISPIIAEPFLLNKDCTNLILNSSKTHHPVDFTSRNLTQPIHSVDLIHDHSTVDYAFYILSALQFPVIFLLAFLVLRDIFRGDMDDENPTAPELAKEARELHQREISPTRAAAGSLGVPPDVKQPGDEPPATREQTFLTISCTTIILFLYDGIQAGFGGYIFSYGVKSIADMSMSEAAYLNACYWGSFAFGRLISIGIATRISPSFMLICNISGCLSASLLMLLFRESHGVLYVGTVMFGTSLSSVFPTSVSLAENYIHVTSGITSIFVVCAAAGEMIMPVIIGHEFDSFGPASVLVSGVIVTLLSLVVYGVLIYTTGTIIRNSSEQSLITRLKHLLNARKVGSFMEESGVMQSQVHSYVRMRSTNSQCSLAEVVHMEPAANEAVL